jgi:hypothetical protein
MDPDKEMGISVIQRASIHFEQPYHRDLNRIWFIGVSWMIPVRQRI